MTKKVNSSKLSREILGLIGLSAAVSLILFFLLSRIAEGAAEVYCFENDIPMTEFNWIAVDRWIFGVSGFLSCCCFSVLFLFLLHDRIAYIRQITAGIDALHTPNGTVAIPLEWNNELTELARAINHMSQIQRQLWEKEQTLAKEKEDLIRTLSHDIRTPLTSILAYSDYLSGQEELSPAAWKAHMDLIRKKAEQIRDLTAILLDGSRRSPEYFEDARLLMEQLAAEFQEELEEKFDVRVDTACCPAFSGTFDVQELRRIFDNLTSNVRKYADPAKPVSIAICTENGGVLLRQRNFVLPGGTPGESYGIGLNSIRRIAQHYGGTVSTEFSGEEFSIAVRLPNI